jgi:hypothetical protein
MMVHQEKIAPPEPLPFTGERSDVLKLQCATDPLELENPGLASCARYEAFGYPCNLSK